MNRNSGKPQDTAPAPSRKATLLWWVAFYLVGVLLFVHEAVNIASPPDPQIPLFLAPFLIFISPCGLGMVYGGFFHWLGNLAGATNPRTFFILDLMAVVLAYASYLGHLALIQLAKTRLAFLFLMVLFVLMISAWSMLNMIYS